MATNIENDIGMMQGLKGDTLGPYIFPYNLYIVLLSPTLDPIYPLP